MKKSLKTEKKIRNFAFLVYEDSAQENWKEKLTKLFIPSLYIYHDQDLDSDGSIKKPHYHVLVMLDTPHGARSIKRIVESIGGANGSFCDITNLKSYARYLCHLDNPEKHRYQESEVIPLNGADYEKFMYTESDKIRFVEEIIAFCRQNSIFSYATLVDYCMDKKPHWFKIICGYYGRTIRDYIRSHYWEFKENKITSLRSDK